MLTMFVNKHKRDIHQLLNLMWKNVEFIRRQLADRKYSVGPLVYGVGNYVSINGKLEPAHYHTPEFGFSYGVVGCTLDGLNFVMAVESARISEVFLKDVIKNFPMVQIYGGKDFKHNFYPCPDKEKKILQRIRSSQEETIQLDITISDPWDRFREVSIQLLDIVEKLVEIVSSHKIKIINPMQSPKYKESHRIENDNLNQHLNLP